MIRNRQWDAPKIKVEHKLIPPDSFFDMPIEELTLVYEPPSLVRPRFFLSVAPLMLSLMVSVGFGALYRSISLACTILFASIIVTKVFDTKLLEFIDKKTDYKDRSLRVPADDYIRSIVYPYPKEMDGVATIKYLYDNGLINHDGEIVNRKEMA